MPLEAGSESLKTQSIPSELFLRPAFGSRCELLAYCCLHFMTYQTRIPSKTISPNKPSPL